MESFGLHDNHPPSHQAAVAHACHACWELSPLVMSWSPCRDGDLYDLWITSVCGVWARRVLHQQLPLHQTAAKPSGVVSLSHKPPSDYKWTTLAALWCRSHDFGNMASSL